MDLHTEDGFKHFVYPHKRKIVTICSLFFRQKEDVEDAVSEIFLKLWQRRDDLCRVVNLDAHVFIVARNYCLDQMKIAGRRRKRFRIIIDEIERYRDDIAAYQADLLEVEFYEHGQKLLYEEMGDLPPKRKKVMDLHIKEQLSRKEIATRMGISTSAVKDHIDEAMKKLKERLRNKDLHCLLLLVALPAFYFLKKIFP